MALILGKQIARGTNGIKDYNVDSDELPTLAGVDNDGVNVPNTFTGKNNVIDATVAADALNKNYVVGGGDFVSRTKLNKHMAVLTTVSDGDKACNTAIEVTPSWNGYVKVKVNGIQVSLADGTPEITTKECYFKSPGGAVRLIEDITAGDFLYWVGSIAGFELENGFDEIDFDYEIPPKDDNPEPPPTTLQAFMGFDGVGLSWVDNSSDELFFEVQRKTGSGGTWGTLLTTLPNVTGATDTTAAINTTYFYRLRAYNGIVYSDWSNEAEIYTEAPSGAPTWNAFVTVSNTRVNLSWVPHSTNHAGFELQRIWYPNPAEYPWYAGPDYEWKVVNGRIVKTITSYSAGNIVWGQEYNYRVRAINFAGATAWSSLLDVSTKLMKPTARAATALGGGVSGTRQIKVSWTDTSLFCTDFRIERSSTGTGSWSTLYTQADVRGEYTSVDGNEHTYTDTGLNSDVTWYYRVITTSTAGLTESDPSDVMSAKTWGPPADPSDFVASLVTNGIQLTWTNNEPIEILNFELERAIDSGGWTPYEILGVVTSYLDTDDEIPIDSVVHYRIRATNDETSNWVDTAVDFIVPDDPTSLTATAISNTTISLAWTDNSDNESGFRIERSPTGTGSWTELATVNPNTETYNDNSCSEATTYYYRVYAFNFAGDSDNPTNTDDDTTWLNPVIDLSATSVVGGGYNDRAIDLSWTDVSTHETGYEIWKRIGTGSWNLLTTTAASATSYQDDNLLSSTLYSYKLITVNVSYHSSIDSNVASTTTYGVPADPSGFTAIMGSSQIDLQFIDNAWDETGFEIERKTGSGGTYALLKTVGAGVQGWYVNTFDNDVSLVLGTTYYYRVRAYNGEYSNWVETSVLYDVPLAASDLTASRLSEIYVLLGWTDNSDNESGFKVQRSPNGSSSWTTIYTTGSNQTSFVDLVIDTEYFYRVIATNWAGDASPSNTASIWMLGSPTNLSTVWQDSQFKIYLTWNDNSAHETGYIIERSLSPTTGWAEIITLPADSEDYTDDFGVQQTHTYYYRVKAIKV